MLSFWEINMQVGGVGRVTGETSSENINCYVWRIMILLLLLEGVMLQTNPWYSNGILMTDPSLVKENNRDGEVNTWPTGK